MTQPAEYGRTPTPDTQPRMNIETILISIGPIIGWPPLRSMIVDGGARARLLYLVAQCTERRPLNADINSVLITEVGSEFHSLIVGKSKKFLSSDVVTPLCLHLCRGLALVRWSAGSKWMSSADTAISPFTILNKSASRVSRLRSLKLDHPRELNTGYEMVIPGNKPGSLRFIFSSFLISTLRKGSHNGAA